MSNRQQQFLVNKNDLADTRWVESAAPEASTAGDLVVRINNFALTANNITYAVAGDSMQYWDFFPATEGWGQIPVWGFGTVTASAHPDVPVGQRLYGYYPMASHLKIQAERVTKDGLIDAAEHRSHLARVYNQYQRAGQANASDDAAQMLYRPLYMTSFVLDDFVSRSNFFGAQDVLLTSASSKTSLGLAFLLHKRGGCNVVGLTSAKNKAFVESLGCYHQVKTYDEITTLDANRTAMVVDMAGNGNTLAAVHNHYDAQLKYSCLVGATHWNARSGAKGMAGPKPELFFAPSHIEQRTKDWGPGGLQERFQGAWNSFTEAAARWIEVQQVQGEADIATVYQRLLKDDVNPAQGFILNVE
jgi:NADPH:quinone reductase-like Zn-dependent oxidoreductase